MAKRASVTVHRIMRTLLLISALAMAGCADGPPVRSTTPVRLPVEPFPGLVNLPTCPDVRGSALSALGPDYPRGALRIRQEGWVIVEFDITTDGLTSNARVLAASPLGVFEESALGAIAQWKYRPNEPRVGCRTDVRYTIKD